LIHHHLQLTAADLKHCTGHCLQSRTDWLHLVYAVLLFSPLQVQKHSIPVLISGRDALVRSPTGSGKTLAYLAPMVHSLAARQPKISRADGTFAVVLVPTRELAVQVRDAGCITPPPLLGRRSM
jgi:superfamily II DNA/RNA helicase